MANGHGGARPGAGRKPSAVAQVNRETFDTFCNPERQLRALSIIYSIATDKEHPHCVSAARLFFEYAVGRPPQMVITTGEDPYRDYVDRVRRVILGDEVVDREPLPIGPAPSRS